MVWLYARVMDDDLINDCRRLLDDGLPADVAKTLIDERAYVPLAIDVDEDVAAVAVLRSWSGPPGRPGGSPRPPARRPILLVDVQRFLRRDGDWLSLGGGGGRAPEDPLGARPASADLGGYVLCKSYGDRLAPPAADAPQTRYVGHAVLRSSAEVERLRVGRRELPLASHGIAVVVWPSEQAPTIEALGADGSCLETLDLSRLPDG